jgi:hypothetical protein
MKKSELQSLINECIGEVLNEGKAAKKKEAIKKIKSIIAENEIDENELDEIFGLGKKENAEGKARLEKQYDELAAKATKKAPKEAALAYAKKEDNYEGTFMVDRGVMQYKSKAKGLQGKTGGSSGMGTANG